MKRFLVCTLLGLALCFSGVTGVKAVDAPKPNIGLISESMTFDGNLNPRDAVDDTKFKPVRVIRINEVAIILFAKAIDTTASIQYVAVTFLNYKVIAVTYWENGRFIQIGMVNLEATHFSKIEKSRTHYQQMSRDFEKIFGVNFPINESI